MILCNFVYKIWHYVILLIKGEAEKPILLKIKKKFERKKINIKDQTKNSTWFPSHSKLKYASSQAKYFRKKALKSAYPKLPNINKAVALGNEVFNSRGEEVIGKILNLLVWSEIILHA